MSGPVRLHPDQPRRLSWRGRASFLLGSTEHYGAVLNRAFDYERYLDTIASDGLTLTRAFAAGYREMEESLGAELGHANTLAPRAEEYVAPWARARDASDAGPDGLPRFDLETWDERYFARLRGFLAAAAARGVVVELVLFCNQYEDVRWQHSPLHPASNVNGVGTGMRRWRDFTTLADPSVAEHQRRLVRKLVTETNEFDNLYYEICNEPAHAQSDLTGLPDPEPVRLWQLAMIETIRETERALPKRHLVAVNCQEGLPVRAPDVPDDFPVTVLDDGCYRHEPAVDLLNVHYISQRGVREGLHQVYAGARRTPYRLGNVATFVALRAAAGKAIGFDEDYTGMVHGRSETRARVPRPAQARMEAWESLLAGCATYDHLDLTFTPGDPTGSAAGALPAGLPREWLDGRALRRHFSHVGRYAAELDLASLGPDLVGVQQTPHGMGAVVARANGAVGAGHGEKVAIYLADTRPFDQGYGETPLGGTLRISAAPEARFAARALDPQSGRWTDVAPVVADGRGGLAVAIAPFREDVLIELTHTGRGAT